MEAAEHHFDKVPNALHKDAIDHQSAGLFMGYLEKPDFYNWPDTLDVEKKFGHPHTSEAAALSGKTSGHQGLSGSPNASTNLPRLTP